MKNKHLLLSVALVFNFLTVGCLKDSGDSASKKGPSKTQVDCSTSIPQIEGSFYVEAGRQFQLTFPVEVNPRWIIFLPDGEQIFNGNTLQLTIDDVGQYRGQAWGFNRCNERQWQDFVLVVLPQLGEPRIVINSGATKTLNALVSLTLTARNANEMYLTNDSTCQAGGEWRPFESSKIWTLAGESADARVYAKFRTPARTSVCVSDGIFFDVTPPVVSFVKVPEAQSFVADANFEFSATDNASGVESFECAFQNESFAPCALTRELSGLRYGNYRMSIRATDKAGLDSDVKMYNWSYLNTPPRISILTHPNDISDSNEAIFTFLAEDDSNVIDRYECKLNNTRFTECLTPNVYTQLENGSYTFIVRAFDREGLVSNEASFSWKVDVVPPPPPEPPTVRFTKTPDLSTPDFNAEFQFVATHSGVGIKSFYCQLDNLATAVCQSPLFYEKLAAGEHTLSVLAVDNDNLRSEPISFKWRILKPRVPVKDRFVIDSSSRKIDILIVNDNSPSMTEEQKKMAKRFATFLAKIADLDWQLAMVTTDARRGSKQGQDGRFLNFVGLKETTVIDKNTPNVEKVFADTVVRKEWGASDEEGIHSLSKTFLRPENRPFFRDRSHVASIVISDEDESSDGKKLKPVNLPENLINTFQQQFGSGSTYSHHSIVLRPGYNPKKCPQVGASYFGDTYVKLSQLTGGVVGDICAPDYGDILKGIGDHIRGQAFTAILKCEPVGEVEVRYSPTPNLPIQKTIDGLKLTLTPQPEIGTKIDVTYFCE